MASIIAALTLGAETVLLRLGGGSRSCFIGGLQTWSS
jgi:hypothetical protein